MAVSMNLECKKIALLSCFKALILTIVAQTSFLGAFIVLLNFDLFHPMNWFLQLFGFHWLKHVPLLGVLLVNGLILSKSLVAANNYYPNRFKWLLDNGMPKVILLSVETLLGILTAWSFMSYLNSTNSSLYAERNGFTIINSRYTFLAFAGIVVGVYYFVRYHLRRDILLQFDFIPKPTFSRLREAFLNCLWTSARNTILPTIAIAFLYWIFGGMINRRLALLFGVGVDDSLDNLMNIFTNISLLLYVWLIAMEFFMILSLMEHAFSIFLTTQCCFPITGNLLDANQVTLAIALSMNDVPVVQKLAALDFYNLAKVKSSDRRKEIYALSQPGGHPYNWNQLSGQCLVIINAYVDELNNSLKSFPATIQTTPSVLSMHNGLQTSATEMAQRILIRQYNEKHNIRRLKSELHPIEQNTLHPSSTVARINENFNRTTEEITKRIITTFQSLPGLSYMFGEPEGAKLSYLLSSSDILIWIIQGLAYVCAVSLIEDPYGIVQLTLPEIMKTLLKFKTELDRLSSVNLNSKKMDPNLMPLRNALKRSLHKICNAFAEYLPEIVEDPNDLPYLRTFLYQHSKC